MEGRGEAEAEAEAERAKEEKRRQLNHYLSRIRIITSTASTLVTYPYMSIFYHHPPSTFSLLPPSPSFFFRIFYLINYIRQNRDSLKQSGGASKGITIINVPFWWDWSIDRYLITLFSFLYPFFILSSLSLPLCLPPSLPPSLTNFVFLFCSLVATIKSKRRDLLQDRQTSAQPLSDVPPEHVLEKWNFGMTLKRERREREGEREGGRGGEEH